MTDAEQYARREFLKRGGLAVAATAAGGALLTTEAARGGRFEGVVHGVCWLGGKNCKVTYVDLGPARVKGTPIYVLPSSGANPFDSGGNYRPERLQNNVFAGGGRVWPMWIVVSGSLDLFASTDGTKTIYSTVRAPAGSPLRDLTTNPFRSEEEIFAARDRGELVVTFTGMAVDCPITAANPGDIVVDLNPTVGVFCPKA